MEITILIYLFILSLFDIFYNNRDWGMIPDSIATFFPIFILFLIPEVSIFGLITMFLFSIILYNLKFFSGFQDIKIMTGLGALINYKIELIYLVGIIMIVGLIFKFGVKIKSKNKTEFPFIPVFFITYLIFEVIKLW